MKNSPYENRFKSDLRPSKPNPLTTPEFYIKVALILFIIALAITTRRIWLA